jgi:alpha-beta hydrolase superfamily lysophospholipase
MGQESTTTMTPTLVRWTKRLLAALAIVLLTVFVVRAWQSQQGPDLSAWHLVAPHEMTVAELDEADWAAYVAREARLFQDVQERVSATLPEEERVASNRYFPGSPLYPPRLARDWNRSFVLEPAGPPRGAVVLLHGLTDSPYSLRHVAQFYRDRGFLAFGIRLPGHGTVPAGLADVAWPDWLAAVRLAVREAHRRVPAGPLHLVGYSNGGALATKYTLDALGNGALPRPDRVVLFSPMIGVTGFARFAGIAGWPAYVPRFAKAAWLSILPEFNPFKYNSFPVNAATQSHRLTQAVQEAVRERARSGVIQGLPPILTFQSVMDFTVSTPAILTALYAHLPANGSEIVLFDLNRAAKFGPLLRPSAQALLGRILPSGPLAYRATVVTNRSPDDRAVEAQVREPGEASPFSTPLPLAYPAGVYSLSHVALPFPLSDGLYGLEPDPNDQQGIRLGTLAVRGETGVLVVDADTLMRMSSNPFFPLVTERLASLVGP